MPWGGWIAKPSTCQYVCAPNSKDMGGEVICK